MSDENTSAAETTDLDLFSADLFGQKSAPPVEAPASAEDEVEAEVQSDALETDTPVEDADGKPEVEKEEEVEVEETEPKLTPTQKRINEVVAKQRAAERALEAEAAARKELEQRIAELQQKQTPVPEKTGPNPDDLNEDGTEKYPLGEFDRDYVRDLVRFENERDRQEYESKRAQEEELRVAAIQQEARVSEWNEKLGPARERYPDFEEAGQQLVESFHDLDQSYGEYLASTIMDMEFGPDVLYYLAQNPDEASEIVNSGARKATIRLGRLEAKFAEEKAEKVIARPRVSKAPTPPPQNKGNNAATGSIPIDTEDLDLFTDLLFKKRS